MPDVSLKLEQEFVVAVMKGLQDQLTDDRKTVRLQGENAARQLLENKVGALTDGDIVAFQNHLNADLINGKPQRNRFAPAFMGHNAQLVAKNPAAFNKWSAKLWSATDEETPAILDEFWKSGGISGAGSSLPTAILYLKNPASWGIWMGGLTNAVMDAFPGLTPGKARTSAGYVKFNTAYLAIMEQLQISPVFMDLALWAMSQKTTSPKDRLFRKLFGEFVDTFAETPEGQTHLQEYGRERQQGRQNYQEIFEARKAGQQIEVLVLDRLLPHANTEYNRAKNAWTHIAPDME